MGLLQETQSTKYSILFFFSLGPHPVHMDVPRLGVKSKLQLTPYTTATAAPDPQPTEQGQELNPRPHGHQTLVRLVPAEPQRELLDTPLFFFSSYNDFSFFSL